MIQIFIYIENTLYTIGDKILTEQIEPSEFHCLNKAIWKELPDRTIGGTGNCYVGREYKPDKNGQRFEIRVYVREIKEK